MSFRLFKDVTAAAVHQTTALGNDGRKKKPKAVVAEAAKPITEDGIGADKRDADWSITVPIAKADDELRTVWGWASVTHEAGQVVTDTQGDQIDIGDLVKAAHGFMTDSRIGGDMHDVMGIGTVVESLVFSPDVQKALGVDLGKIGWFIGLRVTDDGVWKRVKDGELAAFSFGGRAVREAVSA